MCRLPKSRDHEVVDPATALANADKPIFFSIELVVPACSVVPRLCSFFLFSFGEQNSPQVITVLAPSSRYRRVEQQGGWHEARRKHYEATLIGGSGSNGGDLFTRISPRPA